jgi:ribosome biogenesis GTPase A
VRQGEDGEATLEAIALKLNMLIKGGKPDIMRAARKIIRDWQRGEIS